jgi:hypothetical protein
MRERKSKEYLCVKAIHRAHGISRIRSCYVNVGESFCVVLKVGWFTIEKNYKVTRRSVPRISLQYQLPRSPFFETLYCFRGTESGCSFCNTQWLHTCYLRVNKFSLFLASIDK